MRKLVAYVAASIFLTSCFGASPRMGSGPQRVSDPLPDLTGVDLHGEQLSAADFRGKVLVINVWASWCDPCEAEQPELVRVAERYAGDGVAFLGINHTDQQAAAQTFAERFAVPYPSLYDPSGRFSASLGYFLLPDTFVVDEQGMIRYAIWGATDEQELSGLLDELLAPQSSTSAATEANSAPK